MQKRSSTPTKIAASPKKGFCSNHHQSKCRVRTILTPAFSCLPLPIQYNLDSSPKGNFRFELHSYFLFAQGGWKAFFLFYPFVMLLVALLQYRLQRPIATVTALLYGDAEVPADLKERAKRRLLNLPFFIALVNFLIYLIVPGCVVFSFFLFWDLPLKTCLFIYFRTAMIGLIAGSLSFFLVVGHARETAISWARLPWPGVSPTNHFRGAACIDLPS